MRLKKLPIYGLRRLSVVLAGAMAVLAVAVPSASASNSITAINEGTGTVCSNLGASHLTGGCRIHAEGVVEFRIDLGIFGEMHQTDCGIEYDIRFGGNGEVAFDDQELYDLFGGGWCSGSTPVVTECDLPWEGVYERDAAHTFGAVVAFCIDNSELSSDCVGNLAHNLVETEATEALTIVFNNVSVGLCELDMDLAVETGDTGDTYLHIN